MRIEKKSGSGMNYENREKHRQCANKQIDDKKCADKKKKSKNPMKCSNKKIKQRRDKISV